MRRLALSVLLGWTAWVSAMLLLAGHGSVAGIGAGLLVGAQAAAGVVLIARLAPTAGALATFGLGSLSGFVLAGIGGILVLGTPVVAWGWLLPLLLATPFVRSDHEVVGVGDLRALAVLVATAGVVGLSTEWTWLAPTALAMVALSVVRRGSMLGDPFVDSSATVRRVVAILAGASVVVQGIVIGLRSPYWSQYRQSRLDIPDHMFFDGIGRAAARYGGSDNAFLAGVDAPYHWFSYAWSGRITILVEGYSPALVSHVVQVAFVPLVGVLTTLVAVRLGARVGSAAAAGLFSVAIVGVPITLAQTLVAYSPSQVAATAIVLAVVGVVVGGSPIVGSRWSPVILVVAGFAAVGSKAVAIVPLVALGAVYPLVRSGSTFLRRSTTSLSLGIGVVGGYLYFLSGRIAGDTSGILATSVADVAIADGPIGAGSDGPAMRLIGVLALTALLVTIVPGVAFVRRLGASARPILAAGLAPVMLGLVYVGGREGVNYFFNVGLAVLVPLAVVGIDRRSHDGGDASARSIAIAAGSGLVVAAGWSNAYLGSSSTSVSTSLFRASLLIVPAVVALTVAAISTAGTSRAVVAAVGMMAVGVGSYVTWVPRYAALHLRQGDEVVADSDLLSGRPEYREALDWLRVNSSADDAVATNRLCDDAAAVFPECYAAWSLVAAVSDRRVYAECPSFTSGWFPAMSDRIALSSSFARSPSPTSAARLWDDGVRWMFVDRAVDADIDYGSLAVVRFENDHARILELSGVGP